MDETQNNEVIEIFVIWQYDSFEIEKNMRSDQEHIDRVKNWYEKVGGRKKYYIKNIKILSSLLF